MTRTTKYQAGYDDGVGGESNYHAQYVAFPGGPSHDQCEYCRGYEAGAAARDRQPLEAKRRYAAWRRGR